MCKAFSCLVLKSGEVKWQFAIDSHSELVEKFNLRDDTAARDELQFAKVEITPSNGDYFNPKDWTFKIDESITPTWWTPLDEKAAWKAHAAWKRQLDKLLVRKPIIHPFSIKPPRKITRKQLQALNQWASVRASASKSAWESVWAYTGSFFNLPRKAWKYTENITCKVYPFQPCVELWESGLVPSFDGKKWRLHGGKNAKVLWEGKL